MKFVHVFYTYKMSRVISLGLDQIYSAWIINEFKSVGEDIVIGRLARLCGADRISIGSGTRFGRHGVLTAWCQYRGQKLNPQVFIGSGCDFGEYLHLTCTNGISIGDNVLTGRWVTISDNSHGDTSLGSRKQPPSERVISSKGKVRIANNVWIGDKVTILAGTTIGEGAIIAANAVVTKDVPPYSTVAGCPARIVKQSCHASED